MKSIFVLMLIFHMMCQSVQKEPFRFKPPLKKGRITSILGGRWGRLHFGVDIGSPKYTPVYTTGRGTVVAVLKKDRIYGNRVDVYHPDIGLYSSYSHLQEIHVTTSQKLNDGDLIGLVGTTGKSTGYHLHFEVYNTNGVYLNPLGLIDGHNYERK